MATELAPGFLVASPTLTDPNFARSVVLLVDHHKDGSVGFVINRPAGIGFRGVVEELGLKKETFLAPDVPVLLGGPVARQTGWVVFDPTSGALANRDGLNVGERVRVSASKDLLEILASSAQKEVHRQLLVLGYAGWGSGQLDQEIAQGAWIPVDLSDDLVFDTPYENRWKKALDTLGINPSLIVGAAIG
jgi:putative transcriptional regulator